MKIKGIVCLLVIEVDITRVRKIKFFTDSLLTFFRKLEKIIYWRFLTEVNQIRFSICNMKWHDLINFWITNMCVFNDKRVSGYSFILTLLVLCITNANSFHREHRVRVCFYCCRYSSRIVNLKYIRHNIHEPMSFLEQWH